MFKRNPLDEDGSDESKFNYLGIDQMARQLLFMALAAIVGLILFLAPAKGEVCGDIGALDEVYVAYESNLAKLRTWLAEMEVRDGRWSHEASGTYSNAVSIAFDRESSSSLIRWRNTGSSMKVNRKVALSVENLEKYHLIVGHNLTSVMGFNPLVNKSGPIIVTGRVMKEQPAGFFEDRIVPLELFWYRGMSLSKRLELAVHSSRTVPSRMLSVAKQDQLVKLHREYEKGSEDITIDLSKGGMVVSASIYSNLESVITTCVDADYECQSGVWVPSKIHRSRRIVGSDGNARRDASREIIWTSNKVNCEIDPSEFTVDALRKNGPATLVDRRTMSSVRLGDEHGNILKRAMPKRTLSTTKAITFRTVVGRLYTPYTFLTLFSIVVLALFALPRSRKTSKRSSRD